jgi:hypothetical protein
LRSHLGTGLDEPPDRRVDNGSIEEAKVGIEQVEIEVVKG